MTEPIKTISSQDQSRLPLRGDLALHGRARVRTMSALAVNAPRNRTP